MTARMPQSATLLQRLEQGPVICAEGYVFELERRGYLQAGAFVPEVVLEHPEAVTQLHRDFVHAGSDVVEALTYYAHREKLRVIGREGDLEPINRKALELARTVARESGTLFAGNICNTNIFDPADRESHRAVRSMFEEQVGWAADAGCDFVIGETFSYAQEALIALDVIKAAGQPAMMTLAVHQEDVTRENWTVVDACKRLADAGADVVGLNCTRGPGTMMPLLKKIRAGITTHVAALPVPYRTHDGEPTFQSLRDPHWHGEPGGRPFPIALDPFTCNRHEIAAFGKEALAMDIRYLGVCCGAGPHHIRALAEAVGKRPPASRYSADMSKHAFLGSHERIRQVQKDYASKL
ncbi:MAG TPA: homocysteine S-methyltransferase family protein [Casimicrobiaceae bacterium]|nr:homocysteine S-methyltransferase family protein [Casimicrobiaceae bacterium]